MAKGPNSIYRICVAKARDIDKNLARGETDNEVLADINAKHNCPAMLEMDVKRIFFENNYGDKKTDKAIKQWIELGYVARIPYNKYWAILFMDYDSHIKKKAVQGA